MPRNTTRPTPAAAPKPAPTAASKRARQPALEPAAKRAPAPAPARRPRAIALDGSLWLQQGGHLLGGADRVALLEAIRDTGSMTRAAKAVGISYKTAWDRVQGMNNGAGRALVERSAGGVGGGGTLLTPYALALIAAFRELEQTHTTMLGRLSKSMAQPGEVLRTLATLGLRTSARNQLAGTIAEVRAGAVNALVALALPGGVDRIFATLTLASLRELKLKKGAAAVALIKAPSVFIAADDDASALRLSVRNALRGAVTRIQTGAVNTEVQARLVGGQTMVAMLSDDSVQRLALRVGAPVRLLFQESSVILGVV
jgi:molybdate transport system regulatory protein